MDEEEQREPMSPILKYVLVAGAILLVLALFVVYAIRAGHPAANIVNGTTVSRNVECRLTHRLPDPECTPGKTIAVTKVGICAPDYPIAMNIDRNVELDVYRRYGISGMDANANWTLQFLIPIALGGDTDESNIYPMSSDYPGYIQRDRATQTLREQVCNKDMPLEVAQDIIQHSWWEVPTLYQSIGE